MNWKYIKIFILSLLCICLGITGNAQLLDIKNYSIEDGLPQSQIINIFQDHTGIIWLTTNGGGVSRFDGKKFHNLGTKQGLNNNRVFSVFEDGQQTIWIGTAKGLNKYINGKLVKVNNPLFEQLTVYTIHEHSNGDLWFGTSNGIITYNGTTFTHFVRNDSIGENQVWSIKQDKLGNTWIVAIHVFPNLSCLIDHT